MLGKDSEGVEEPGQTPCLQEPSGPERWQPHRPTRGAAARSRLRTSCLWTPFSPSPSTRSIRRSTPPVLPCPALCPGPSRDTCRVLLLVDIWYPMNWQMTRANPMPPSFNMRLFFSAGNAMSPTPARLQRPGNPDKSVGGKQLPPASESRCKEVSRLTANPRRLLCPRRSSLGGARWGSGLPACPPASSGDTC